ncbi:MAG: DHA2 family efflux MFS transporter permease subunit [Thermomicrobiales bacterium]|nr:DHA2 family efflux MFS transporter permease subunit [Thermomicrobiales bacterium]
MFRQFTSNQKYIVATVYVIAMVLNSLDSTIVNVTLATLGREFGVPASEVEAVTVWYLVSLAVVMPASGWLADRFGTKNVFLFSLAVYTLTSFAAGFAQTLDQLVFWRIVQGFGGGLLVPVGMSMLFRTFPPAERISVGRVLMFATILGPAIGPILGGAILEFASWPWTFFVKVPVAGSALLFGWRYLRDERDDIPAGKLDWIGFVLGGGGLGAAMFAMLQGPDMGWANPVTLICGLGGLSALVIFVWHELRTSAPMVDLRLLTNRLFSSTIRVSFFATIGFMGVLFVVPLFLQEVLQASPLHAGLATMPEAVGVVASTQIVARIYPKFGPSKLMGSSMLAVTIAILAMVFFTSANLPLWMIGMIMFTIGAGMAGLFLPNQAASMATIQREKLSGASMVSSVQRQVGGAVGVAVTSTVLSIIGVTTVTAGGPEANMLAWKAALVVAAVATFIASCMGWLVPDEDAAETMQRGA